MTALVEELELPLNVHRWRKLESSDPERYDLVRKAQTLQRSLVSKTENAIRKDLLIQEKVRDSCLLVGYGYLIKIKCLEHQAPGPSCPPPPPPLTTSKNGAGMLSLLVTFSGWDNDTVHLLCIAGLCMCRKSCTWS